MHVLCHEQKHELWLIVVCFSSIVIMFFECKVICITYQQANGWWHISKMFYNMSVFKMMMMMMMKTQNKYLCWLQGTPMHWISCTGEYTTTAAATITTTVPPLPLITTTTISHNHQCHHNHHPSSLPPTPPIIITHYHHQHTSPPPVTTATTTITLHRHINQQY